MSIKEPNGFLVFFAVSVAFVFISLAVFLTFSTAPAAFGAIFPKPNVLSKNLGETIGLGRSVFLFKSHNASALCLKYSASCCFFLSS